MSLSARAGRGPTLCCVPRFPMAGWPVPRRRPVCFVVSSFVLVARPATRRATDLQPLPMAATAAFWAATPVAVAPAAENAAAPSAGAPVVRERAERKAPLPGTTFDYGAVIKF